MNSLKSDGYQKSEQFRPDCFSQNRKNGKTMLKMRSLMLLFILTLISVPLFSQTRPDSTRHEDDWFGQDKIKHFTVSAWIGTATALELQNMDVSKQNAVYSAIAVSLATGIGKEIYDSTKKGNIFSYRDLVWDMLGISFFVMINSSI